MTDHAFGFATVFLMWMIMMGAMMAPAVTPWVGVLARVAGAGEGRTVRTGAAFLGGYFLMWAPYALLGAGLQAMLQHQQLLVGGRLGLLAGSGVLIGAGVFQWSPLKAACLEHCRSPLGFFLEQWHDGPPRAWKLGAKHGLFCLGCCWALMAVAFVVGVMSLVWMAAIALAVWVEQVIPGGHRAARVVGVGLIVWGVARLAA